MAAIDSYLHQVLEKNGSDLHFLAGDPARVRQYGELKALGPEPLAAEAVKTMLYEIMPKLSVSASRPRTARTSLTACRGSPASESTSCAS